MKRERARSERSACHQHHHHHYHHHHHHTIANDTNTTLHSNVTRSPTAGSGMMATNVQCLERRHSWQIVRQRPPHADVRLANRESRQRGEADETCARRGARSESHATCHVSMRRLECSWEGVGDALEGSGPETPDFASRILRDSGERREGGVRWRERELRSGEGSGSAL